VFADLLIFGAKTICKVGVDLKIESASHVALRT
jgi:hypothetical protein